MPGQIFSAANKRFLQLVTDACIATLGNIWCYVFQVLHPVTIVGNIWCYVFQVLRPITTVGNTCCYVFQVLGPITTVGNICCVFQVLRPSTSTCYELSQAEVRAHVQHPPKEEAEVDQQWRHLLHTIHANIVC